MKVFLLFLSVFSILLMQSCAQEGVKTDLIQPDKETKTVSKYSQAQLNENFLKSLRNKKLQEARLWLNEGADINYADEIDGFTALHFVVYSGDIKSGEWLLAQKPNLAIKNKQGMSAFHLAIREGNLDLVKVFLKYGADPMDKETKSGWAALDFAAFWGHLEIAGLLLAQTISINDQDIDGNTALQKAVLKSELKMIKYLLEKGADPNLKNLAGQTPYLFCKTEEACSLLKQFGAKD